MRRRGKEKRAAPHRLRAKAAQASRPARRSVASSKGRIRPQNPSSADLHNILNRSKLAILFLDGQLRVRFFTPDAAPLFSLIATDLGRPLADLVVRLIGVDLLADARSVLTSATPIQREVKTGSGLWYLCSIAPYRAETDRFDGVVINLADISDLKAVEERSAEVANLGKSRFLAAASHDLRQPLQTLSLLQGALRQRIRDKQSLELIAKADRTLSAMSATLDALLDINQLEAGVPAVPAVRVYASEKPTDGGDRRRVGTILLLEDDELVSEAVKLFLERDGHRVFTVATGEAALKQVMQLALRPDLVICDYNLAGAMTGVRAATGLRKVFGSQLPVVILTGDVRVGVLRDIAKHGYVSQQKPLAAEELLVEVQRLLRGGKRHRAASPSRSRL